MPILFSLCQCPAHHRDLHSFPTRRSSDLELARALNRGLLPADYYALPEQHAAGFGPDVLTLQEEDGNGAADQAFAETPATGGLLLTAPKLQPVAKTDLAFYRRKQDSIAVRHVSGDRLVAMVQ